MAICVFVDIEGAFDNTCYEAVGRVLIKKGVDTTTVQWMNEMLFTRTVETLVGQRNQGLFRRRGFVTVDVKPVVDEFLCNDITKVSEDASGMRDEIHRLCYYFCIPLIATESCLAAGIQDLISMLNLLTPVADYLLRLSSTDTLSAIDMAHFASLASIAYSAILMERNMGFAVICCALMTNLIGTHRVIETSFYPFFTMLLCFTTLSFLTNESLKDIILNVEDVMSPTT